MATLPLERALTLQLQEVLRLAAAQASPRGALTALARKLLAHKFPRLPAGALQPLWLRGEDLKAAGIPEGNRFAQLLSAAAKAQWSGEIFSPGSAQRWLRERLRLDGR